MILGWQNIRHVDSVIKGVAWRKIMFVFVTGGSGSGKSEFAEKILAERADSGEERYYIATMIPFGEEGRRRIERHKRQREGRQFQTIECYRDLERLELPGNCDVLLECMSNLLANEMFQETEYDEREDIEQIPRNSICEKILLGVEHLLEQCRHVVVVTNEVFSDGNLYDKSTMEYINLLGQLNQRLAQRADIAVEVVYSIPVYHKG